MTQENSTATVNPEPKIVPQSTSQDSLVEAFGPKSPQAKLLAEFEQVRKCIQAGGRDSWYMDRQDKLASQILKTYQQVEQIHAAAGYPPAPVSPPPVIDPALIEKLMERERELDLREKRLSERELSSQFSTAAARFGTRCRNSIDDIKAAFADNREELVTLDAAFAETISEKDRHTENACILFILGFADRRAAKACAEEADKIAQRVDIETNRWKLSQPATPA